MVMDEHSRDDRTILNVDRLMESAGGDEALMRELVALYVEDSEDKLMDLDEWVRAGDTEQSGRLAHGLKGSSAAVGAEEAADAFLCVEQMGKSGEAEGLIIAYQQARSAYERARDRLQELAA